MHCTEDDKLFTVPNEPASSQRAQVCVCHDAFARCEHDETEYEPPEWPVEHSQASVGSGAGVRGEKRAEARPQNDRRRAGVVVQMGLNSAKGPHGGTMEHELATDGMHGGQPAIMHGTGHEVASVRTGHTVRT